MEPKGIDELLSGEPVEEVETETPEPEATEEPTEAKAEEGQPRTPDGKFASKQTGVDEEPQEEPKGEAPEPDEAGPPPADQLPKDVYEPLKAVRNENKELKQQLEAIQQQLARQQQQPQQAPQNEPLPDFWEDPQGFLAKQFDQFGQSMMQRFQQQQQVERIEASEAAARSKYADYGDAFKAFQQAAMANPSLVQEMTSAADPAEFAYAKGKSALELERYGSVEELLKAERAKWEAELKAAAPQPKQTFPQTTAADGSVGARTGPEWSGPKPLGELLG